MRTRSQARMTRGASTVQPHPAASATDHAARASCAFRTLSPRPTWLREEVTRRPRGRTGQDRERPRQQRRWEDRQSGASAAAAGGCNGVGGAVCLFRSQLGTVVSIQARGCGRAARRGLWNGQAGWAEPVHRRSVPRGATTCTSVASSLQCLRPCVCALPSALPFRSALLCSALLLHPFCLAGRRAAFQRRTGRSQRTQGEERGRGSIRRPFVCARAAPRFGRPLRSAAARSASFAQRRRRDPQGRSIAHALARGNVCAGI
jgi:hypothetical protein